MPLRKRGKVAVKGKGNMVTFWVGESPPVKMFPKFNAQPMVNFAGDIVTSPPMSVEKEVNRSAMNPLPKHGLKAMGFQVSRKNESDEELERQPEPQKASLCDISSRNRFERSLSQ